MSDREFDFECLMDTLDSILREISNRPTLRDQLAMAALTGMLSNIGVPISGWEGAAIESFKAADAMLKARGE